MSNPDPLDRAFPYREGEHYEIDPVTGCWNWTGFLLNGYGRFTKYGQAHRHGWECIHGELAQDIDVHHRCHNTRCVNPAHLEPIHRRIHRQRHKQAESKLTIKDVVTIRERSVAGESSESLAQEYGLHNTTIWKMIYGISWKNAGGPIQNPERVCQNCGAPMIGRIQKKWCSGACRQAANRAARIANPNKPEPKWRTTHCPHGHEYTPENTLRTRDGFRKCKACNDEKQRRYRERKRAERQTA